MKREKVKADWTVCNVSENSKTFYLSFIETFSYINISSQLPDYQTCS